MGRAHPTLRHRASFGSISLLALLALACSSHAATGYASSDSGAPPIGFDASALCGHADCDGDGYVIPADCDDYNAQINPEAYDFIGDGIDNDCDGHIDNPVVNCETVPASLPGTPTDFARAGDLCAQRSKTNAGTIFDPLIRAAWGEVSGTGGEEVWTSMTKPQQVSIASSFGLNAPRSGTTMVGLSNGNWGVAAPRSDPALDPAGFHLDDACSDIPLVGLDCDSLTDNAPLGAISVQDWAELTLWVQVPTNAASMHFDFTFFSSEFNQWWNSSANDAFFVLVSSKTISGTNVAKDSHGLAVTVNSGFFQLCPVYPGPAVGPDDAGVQEAVSLQQCVGMSGDSSQGILGTLLGTGYDGAGLVDDAGAASDTAQAVDGNYYIYGGGSGWLTTSFGVTPGEQLQMRIVLMDTFDGLKDSVVLVDNMGWGQSTANGVTRPPH
ncbi:MAG: putative metal-binding motif-containing protein [Polyangiaceae bacterium]